MSGHALTLRDRNAGAAPGVRHVHRFAPECSCGWRGRYKRQRSEAEHEYREHVHSVEADRRRSRRRVRRGRQGVTLTRSDGPKRRATTPPHLLPPELRPPDPLPFDDGPAVFTVPPNDYL